MIDISGHLRNYRQECGFEDFSKYISVNCCGFQKFITKNFSCRRDNGRLDYQILYVVKGCGFFHLREGTLEVTEGKIVVFCPGERQSYQYNFQNSPEVYWIHFTGYGAKKLLEEAGLLEQQVNTVGIHTPCIELFKKVIRELQVKKPLFEQSTNAAILELVVQLGRKRIEEEQSHNLNKNHRFDKLLEIMHSNYHIKWSIDDFARQCNMSTYWFIHSFKEYTGMSPLEYLIKIRIDKARELLLDSSLSIKEIASVTGYDNALYFSRVFKKLEGSSPRQYRHKKVL